MTEELVIKIMAACLVICLVISLHFYIELKGCENAAKKLMDDRLYINDQLNNLIELFNEMDKVVQITNIEKMELEKEIIALKTKVEYLEGKSSKDENN